MHCVKYDSSLFGSSPECTLLDKHTLQVGSNTFSLDLAGQALVVKNAEGEKLESASLENVVFDIVYDGVFFSYLPTMKPLLAVGTESGPEIVRFSYEKGHLRLKLLKKLDFVGQRKDFNNGLLKIEAHAGIITTLECCAVNEKRISRYRGIPVLLFGIPACIPCREPVEVPYHFLRIYKISALEEDSWKIGKCYLARWQSEVNPNDCRLEIIQDGLKDKVRVLAPEGIKAFTIPWKRL